jgi:hypothetical protein
LKREILRGSFRERGLKRAMEENVYENTRKIFNDGKELFGKFI